MAETNGKVVQALVDRFFNAYKSRNIDDLSGTVAKTGDFIAFGTDQGEAWYGWESFRNVTEKLFTAIREIDWHRGATHIRFSQDGNTAWFSEELTGYFVSPEGKHECPFRFTGVAMQQGGTWSIVQFHRSVPVEQYAVPYLETHGVRFD